MCKYFVIRFYYNSNLRLGSDIGKTWVLEGTDGAECIIYVLEATDEDPGSKQSLTRRLYPSPSYC